MLNGKTVVLGVCSSIAAYKAATLASLLVKARADVHVLMTENACNIINPIAFESLTGNKCVVNTFDRNFEFKVGHIGIAKQADIFVVAPASANTIARLANGLADDMLATTFLAAKCPKIICPAMNTAMYENPITQANIGKCRAYSMRVVEPESGFLACGDVGRGKMAEPEKIYEHILNEIAFEKDFAGKKILVTAGPTRERIDAVRFVSNYSTGKMGYAVAKNAVRRGAEVVLVSGACDLPVPLGVEFVSAHSAEEMFEAVKERAGSCDIVVKAAAVADYRPKNASNEKIKKTDAPLKIEFERTTDILAFLGERKKERRAGKQFLCGFSMETQSLVENSRAKLDKKNVDMIVANNLKVEGAGFGVDTNVLTIITKSGAKELPLMSKDDGAKIILDEIKSEMDK